MLFRSDGDVVLDVACGTGTLLRALSEKASIQAKGIDLSEGMIRVAKSRCPGMELRTGPCCPLPWGDGSVDVITVCCAFHHFDDPLAFLKECGRVLRKDGRMYIADPYFGAVLRFLANTFWFPFSKSGDVRVYGGRELKALFRRAGLEPLRVYRKGAGIFLHARKQPPENLSSAAGAGRKMSDFP